jgi:hypothetical protein
MSANRGQQSLPDWVVPAVIVFGVLLVAFLAWRGLNSANGPSPGPNQEVRPGMYDFRKEAEKGNLGRRAGEKPPWEK